ncbi:serine carboxypeptidase 1 [Amborella trichopoda]|uniref:serine carboxypeptidase 1 n=1 Tax=Amborella trichopoda TaxID=13333 RepID=UPI0005D37F5E|nr:serine carboxypeptidase 1 [Amborella trichopoda]|eukprot:XP_006840213.2 serine carboxypeptidase 1 [Amborella trichopoda]
MFIPNEFVNQWYITLGNEGNRRHMYYYFATSERNPSKDPIVFWTNGGPGCSGMNAIVYFHGPFKIEDDQDYMINGVKVNLNPFRWTKVSNLVVMDSPIGTGFSYADNSECYETDDSKTIADLYAFVLKWFHEYPEFLSNPLYITGCSYGGAYVPTLSVKIVKGIEEGVKPNLNFKGYSVGNELTDYDILLESKVPFAHRMGLISDKLYEDLRISCQGNYWNSIHPDCLRKMEAFKKNTGGINVEHVLLPHCHVDMGMSRSTRYAEERFQMYDGCEENGYEVECVGTNDIGVSENANAYQHVREIYCYVEVAGRWKRCTDELKYRYEKISLIQHHLNLTLKGYRAFIYSGDHDMTAPYIGTLEWIRRLNYTELESWRPWFVGPQIAGYTVQYEHNLLFATFKGAGHTAAEFTPRESLVAFQRWIDGADNL